MTSCVVEEETKNMFYSVAQKVKNDENTYFLPYFVRFKPKEIFAHFYPSFPFFQEYQVSSFQEQEPWASTLFAGAIVFAREVIRP